MKIWYQSETRFTRSIVKRWNKSGVKFNAGNINILRFAFRTALLYANLKSEKVSEKNKININPRLF
jgi:hypothetical protein